MGAILAKFRREKSTTAVLEGLDENIKQIEKYTLNTQEQKRRIVGNFLAISIGIYVIAFIVFYFIYFPPTWRERIIYSMPLLIFPVVIILLRRLFSWYFERKLNKNSNKLMALRAEKKKILEQVMDKETYKVAVNLLARFGDKNNGHKSLYATTPRVTNTSIARNAPTPRLSIGASPRLPVTTGSLPDVRLRSTLSAATQSSPQQPFGLRSLQTSAAGGGDQTALLARPLALTPQRRQVGQELVRRSTPFPIVNQQNKGVLERIVDVLIGDGPQDRFAMICRECFSHNGMALKEDFDYTTFRCAFCNALNPSRKARPIAPRLPEQHHSPYTVKHSSDSSSSTDIDSDDESRNSERPQVPAIRHTPRIELTEAKPPVTAEAAEEPPGDGPNVKSADFVSTNNELITETKADNAEEVEKKEALQAAAEAEELSRLQERFAKMYATPETELETERDSQCELEADAEPEEDVAQTFEELRHELEKQMQENTTETELANVETNKLK